MNASLKNACLAAIRHGNVLSDIKPGKWAETYSTATLTVTTEDVKEAWEAALTELSRVPSYDYGGEGK